MNIQHSRRLLDVRLVEKHGHLPPDSLSGVMLKTTRTIVKKLQQDALLAFSRDA